MPTTKPHLVTIKGQQLDRKLLNSFRPVSGSVTKAQVEEKIAPKLRDAGRLTDVEVATVEYAVSKYKTTPGAKASLGAIAQQMRGQPVFTWQQGSSGVDVRVQGGAVSLPLSKKAAEKAALDWVLRNVEPVRGASADKPLPNLDSGNNNLHPSIISGAKADKAVKLFLELEGDRAPDALKNYDENKHTVIFTVGTEDETHIFLALLDRTTGKTVHIAEQNTVDIGSSVDEDKFHEIFGPHQKFTSDPDDADAPYDYLDGYVLAEWLQKGAKMLPVHHEDDDRHPARALLDAQYQRGEAIKEALGGASYEMPISISSGRLPVAEGLDTMARLMFEAGRDEDRGVHYEHDNVPITVGPSHRAPTGIEVTIADALLASFPRQQGAAKAETIRTKVKEAMAALGTSASVAMFEVSSAVRHATDRQKTGEATTWAVINEKTGDYVSFYTRPEFN